MTSIVDQVAVRSEAGAGQLPMRKRKKPDEEDGTEASPESKVLKTDDPAAVQSPADSAKAVGMKALKRAPMSKAREVRLEQNRKAARESRRRKKVMIEELQRSVIFFSRANGTLKQQNDEIARLLMQAQAQVAAIENQPQTSPAQHGQPQAQNNQVKTEADQQQQQQQGNFQQAPAQAVATQAMYESQGYPAAAARAAAQTMNAGSNANSQAQNNAPAPAGNNQALPPMQPGATMQAMANFQQAAAAAMQAAVQGMQGIPGLSLSALAAAPTGATPQQAYNDTMTALAMQQAAAAAAAGQQFFQSNPFMNHPMVAWQNQQAAAGAAQQQAPAGQPQQMHQQQPQGVPQQAQMAPAPTSS
jgi:hypothetical protein